MSDVLKTPDMKVFSAVFNRKENYMNPPKIVSLQDTQLIGIKTEMSRIDDKTPELWRSFMPRRNEIKDADLKGFYSVNIYPENYHPASFSPKHTFTKWAAVKASSGINVPNGMELLTIPEGDYAVFEHEGPISKFIENLTYIFSKWLPDSGHKLDNRPHFELIPPNYAGPNSNEAKEEIWVPIK